jgi:hypothetical protein
MLTAISSSKTTGRRSNSNESSSWAAAPFRIDLQVSLQCLRLELQLEKPRGCRLHSPSDRPRPAQGNSQFSAGNLSELPAKDRSEVLDGDRSVLLRSAL